MKAMNLSHIVFFGWYHILDKTIYSFGASREGIGPKEHSFFITFLFHGINLWTILRYLLAKYFSMSVPLYASLFLALAVFVVGYLSFFRKRANQILTQDVKNMKAILFAIIALTYAVISVYLMFKVGNYVREVVVLPKS
jgi:cation transport ATPase